MSFGQVVNETLLLDTHTFIWVGYRTSKFVTQSIGTMSRFQQSNSAECSECLGNATEIQLGKLGFTKPLADMISEQQRRNNLEILPVNLAHALALETLPLLHRIP